MPFQKGNTIGLGRKHTDESKKKMSGSAKGRICSEETKQKMSEAKRGNKYNLGRKQSKERIEKRVKANTGKKRTNEVKNKMSVAAMGNSSALGYKHTEEQRLNQSIAIKGPKSYLWKGGISPINTMIRVGMESQDWRKAVFERDNYTCQKCNKRGDYLQAHHIKLFSEFPELRFEVSNGMTYCKPCHKEIHKHKKQEVVK